MHAMIMAVMTLVELQSAAATGAAMCIGESGWHDLETCAAEVHVIARRAARRGVTFEQHARRFSWALRRAPQLRPWLLTMRDSPEPPRGWPRGPSWARHHELLKPVLSTVMDALRGGADPCPSASNFGSCRLDGRPEGHVRVECLPQSEQCFWEAVR